MTEPVNTTASSKQPVPELSGVDLARVALRQAREAAKARGEGSIRKTKRPAHSTTLQRDGRKPTGFGAVLRDLVADRAWDVPAAGGSVLDQWPAIAAAVSPNLPAHVTAVAFHAESGQLDLRPDSSAYATQVRLISSRIVAAANDTVGAQTVRTVRVLAPGGTAPAPREAAAPRRTVLPEVPVKTRDMAAPGFHRALAAAQAVEPTQRIDPDISEAIERQTRAMRELSRRAFPDRGEAVGEPTQIDAPFVQRRREAEAIREKAVRRARAERAGTYVFPQEPAEASTRDPLHRAG